MLRAAAPGTGNTARTITGFLSEVAPGASSGRPPPVGRSDQGWEICGSGSGAQLTISEAATRAVVVRWGGEADLDETTEDCQETGRHQIDADNGPPPCHAALRLSAGKRRPHCFRRTLRHERRVRPDFPPRCSTRRLPHGSGIGPEKVPTNWTELTPMRSALPRRSGP